MNWIHPEWLWTTVLVLPLALVVLVAGWWHRKRVHEAFGATLAERVLPRSVRVRRTLRDLGALAALLCGAFALAEPAFDKSITQQKVKGVDLVIALDLSRSMNATDVDPSRLERARREIIDLLELVAGDRVAVVFFAGDAIARLPLTEDYRAVRWLLDEADPSMFQAQGSNLARAIAVSRDLLSRDEGKAGKAMVVFSDGESHAPEEALAEAEAARAEGLIIYSVGIGENERTTIPEGGGALRHRGELVYTQADFSTLIGVADRTGGAYVKSVASASDMRSLYAEIRKGVAAVERDSVARESWNSAYQVPLGIGLVLWLGGAWLGDGRRRFGAAGSVLLAVGLLSSSAQAMTPAEADALYRQERFPAAETAFEQLTLEEPTNPDWFRRLGAARYRMGDYVGAANAFERADQLAGGDADALYNAGNARYRAGQLETALERYDRAIADGHAGAQTNRQVVASELQARRAEQPPPPPPPEPQGGGEDEQEKSEGDQGDESEDGGQGDQQQPDQGGQGDQQDPGDQGDQQDGQQDEQQDGSADADGQQQGEQQKEGAGQQGQPSDANPDGDPQQDSEGVNPDQLDEQGEQGDSQGNGSEGDPSEQMSGNITPAQAARMIDGVEEGQLRVRYTGASADKPW